MSSEMDLQGNGEKKLLIIEDNPGDIMLMTTHLKQLCNGDCTFHVERDGQGALEYFKKINSVTEIPHLIFLDLNLPKINGFQVLESLKKVEALKMVPVVVFSSSNSFKDVVKAYSLNVNSYIVKPYNVDEYNEAISNIWKYWLKTNRAPTREIVFDLISQ